MNHLAFLFTVVTVKLAEVLESQTDRHLVGTCRCNQVVQSSEIDGRKLVYNDRAFKLPFLVYQFDDSGIIQSERCGIDVLSVRIIAHTKDFRFLRIIDVQRKIIACHDPVQLWRNHSGKRNFRRSYLALKLVLCPTLPGIHERRKVVLQFRIGSQYGKQIRIRFVQQFHGMREAAIDTIFVYFQIPDYSCQKDNRRLYKEVTLFFNIG